MEFTKEEKDLIKLALKRHLKEVTDVKSLPEQHVGMYKVEAEYEDFVKNIIKKLK